MKNILILFHQVKSAPGQQQFPQSPRVGQVGFYQAVLRGTVKTLS